MRRVIVPGKANAFICSGPTSYLRTIQTARREPALPRFPWSDAPPVNGRMDHGCERRRYGMLSDGVDSRLSDDPFVCRMEMMDMEEAATDPYKLITFVYGEEE